MVVGVLKVTLSLEGCDSLKDKRRIVRSVVDRVRREYHVAIAEVADLDRHRRATLGIACVSNEAPHVNALLDKVLDFIESKSAASVMASEINLEHY